MTRMGNLFGMFFIYLYIGYLRPIIYANKLYNRRPLRLVLLFFYVIFRLTIKQFHSVPDDLLCKHLSGIHVIVHFCPQTISRSTSVSRCLLDIDANAGEGARVVKRPTWTGTDATASRNTQSAAATETSTWRKDSWRKD